MEEQGRDASTLDYARPALHRRRFLAIVLGLAVTAGVITAGAIGWDAIELRWTRARLRWRLSAREAPCLRYIAPERQVIYEEDPRAAATLRAAAPGQYKPIPAYSVTQTNSLSPTTNPTGSPLPVQHVPAAWRDYYDYINPFNPGGVPGVAFMHERTSPGGHRRLVCVALNMYLQQPYARADEAPRHWQVFRSLEAYAIAPDTLEAVDGASSTYTLLLVPPDASADGSAILPEAAGSAITAPFPLRLYAGQVDPDDAARFTIRYELPAIGRRGTIRGALNDDDSVVLTPDSGEISAANASGSQWRMPTTRPIMRSAARPASAVAIPTGASRTPADLARHGPGR